jgi:hypothetical protein
MAIDSWNLDAANIYLRFVGMTPGAVGLYQVNFVVPPPPPGLAACDTLSLSSNLTVTIVAYAYKPILTFSSVATFDGAGICIKPPASQ